ncbi:hypothetical protein [Paenibacillus sp. DMB5]|uniref:hypothetical protein n=1 Tax=Paenibacillus sp. DMB5 TaxID=1780103 RepID=UPI000A57A465|nr:hypothetical protein [Paenibacillus sp. DMB5]
MRSKRRLCFTGTIGLHANVVLQGGEAATKAAAPRFRPPGWMAFEPDKLNYARLI